MSDHLSRDRATRVREIALITVVVAVTLLNGSEFFLKRTGVIDHATYERFLSEHIKGVNYLYLPGGAGFVLKLLKDAVVFALLMLSAMCVARDGAVPPIRTAWPGYLLAASIATSCVLTATRCGLLLPLTGLRAFSFLLLGIGIAGCPPLRQVIVPALMKASLLLLAIETATIGFEAVRGLPIYGTVSPLIPGRLVGTFNLPNTLGVWAVLACTFYLSAKPDSRFRSLAVLLTLMLVLAGGSGTGLVVLGALGAGIAMQRFGRKSFAPIVAIVVVSMALLPVMTGRMVLFQSIPPRLIETQLVYEQLNGAELAVGKAFGAGTNAAFVLIETGNPWAEVQAKRGADSMPAMLLMGNGMLGLLAFYGLLIYATVKDPSFRFFWIAVLLTSLTMKVVEIFPVSLLLSAALARVFVSEASSERLV